MEIIGIVCEYNPFHNGHIYHINKIKEKYPNSIIILILNGYFLERGEISIISKYGKTKIALDHNIDLVVELPVLYGTQSADTFAYNAINILNKLHATHIIFGSETNDIDKIKQIALETEKEEYKEQIQELLNQGVNYPTALAKSINTKFTFLPNDLLGISYVKAINKLNSSIIPETIQRTNSYLDTESSEDIVSAANIRNKILKKEKINKYLPNDIIDKINKVNYDLFWNILKSNIITNNHLEEILDVDEGIEHRLYEGIKKCNNIKDFTEYVKTKRYTYNKINRMFIHIILGIKKEDAQITQDYIKILGLNKNGRNHLNNIKKDLDISVNINKESKIYKYELRAVLLYDMLTNSNNYKKELNNKPIII